MVGAGKSAAFETKRASSVGLSWLQVFFGDVQEMPREKPFAPFQLSASIAIGMLACSLFISPNPRRLIDRSV